METAKNKIRYKKERVRRSKGEKVVIYIFLVICILYAISLIFPFLWMAYNSLKINGREFRENIWGLPQDPLGGLQNYVKVFTGALTIRGDRVTFWTMLYNSLEYSIVLTAVGIFVPLCTAYIVAKYNFKLRGLYYTIAIITITVPVVGGTASMIILLNELNLYGTYLGVYVMGASGFGGAFLLFYSYFKNLSWLYAESAFIDGAGHFKVFLSINLPMALPMVVTVAIMSFLGSWNDYFNIYMYVGRRPTLAYGIQAVQDHYIQNGRNYPMIFAYMLVSVLPGLVIYIAFQKTILENFTVGGLKG